MAVKGSASYLAFLDVECTVGGFLDALGAGGKVWKRKWFEIKDNFLVYSSRKGKSRPDWVIPLEGCVARRSPDFDLCLELTSGDRRYHLRCPSEELLTKWLNTILWASRLTIESKYDIGEKIGVGTFSKVYLGTDRTSGEQRAIKVISKQDVLHNREAMLTEIAIMQKVNHPNIIRVYEIFETKRKLYVVMAWLKGGELFDHIVNQGVFTERDAAKIIRQITEAIAYLHDNGIVHRDIKPENLLYATPELDTIMLSDFGLSRFWDFRKSVKDGQQLLQTACGTPGYVAPEVLTMRGYTNSVDMWSVGVIMYILLCGFPPFYGDNDAEVYRAIKKGHYDFPEPFWNNISSHAKDVVKLLLSKDPSKRLTASELLLHPWITGDEQGVQMPSGDLAGVKSQLRSMLAKKRLRKGVMAAVAARRFTLQGAKIDLAKLQQERLNVATGDDGGGAGGKIKATDLPNSTQPVRLSRRRPSVDVRAGRRGQTLSAGRRGGGGGGGGGGGDAPVAAAGGDDGQEEEEVYFHQGAVEASHDRRRSIGNTDTGASIFEQAKLALAQKKIVVDDGGDDEPEVRQAAAPVAVNVEGELRRSSVSRRRRRGTSGAAMPLVVPRVLEPDSPANIAAANGLSAVAAAPAAAAAAAGDANATESPGRRRRGVVLSTRRRRSIV